jgi:hypothetical protein
MEPIDPAPVPLTCAREPTGESKGGTVGFVAAPPAEFTVAVAGAEAVVAGVELGAEVED